MVVIINLANTELEFLNSIILKSYNNTLNTLINDFREGKIPFGNAHGVVFEKGEKNVSVKLSPENLDYINSVKIASKSHTIKLLIWFASQQNKA